jgi:hypothetical protein
MKILVACEYSNTVSKEFRKLGHTVISCDLLPNDEDQTNHYQGNVFDIINDGWDMLIGFPPCTYLTYAGNAWFDIDKYGDKAKERYLLRDEAFNFFMKLYNSPIDKICLENPRGYAMQFIKPSQIIHPYYFGDPEKKTTCLWLKNLKPLEYQLEDNLFYSRTSTDEPKPAYIDCRGKKRYFNDNLPPSKDRWKIRSKTFPGIAKAMAKQWGNINHLELGRVA